MTVSRRHFLKAAGAVSLGLAGLQRLFQDELLAARTGPQITDGFGPLVPDPDGLLDLPKDFSYEILSRPGDTMDDGFLVPGDPDGMAAFPGPDGTTLLVRNHELSPDELGKGPFGPANDRIDRLDPSLIHDRGRGETPCIGGTTTVVYDTRAGRVESQRLSLVGTIRNCAGGPTPWNSWITCEEDVTRASDVFEHDHGYNFEVPARVLDRPVRPIALRPMGRFNHEAVAVDPNSGIVYQTEDRHDGLIYRFIPDRPRELAAGGRLQALGVRGRPGLDTRNWDEAAGRIRPGDAFDVDWVDLEEIDSPDDDLRLRGFDAGAARFARGEGMWYGDGVVYFACTNGGHARKGQIWMYRPSPAEGTTGEDGRPGTLELFVEPNDGTLIENADNLTVAPWGDLIVCEDGTGDDYLVGVTPDGGLYKFGHDASGTGEFAGATFSPDGSTFFVNKQLEGLTLAITGPWERRTAT